MDAETRNQSDIKLTPGKKFYLTYDEYYNNRELVAQDTSRIKIGAGGMIEKSLTYDQFVEINKSENMFDNDLLEQQYKFWETAIEKEQRLKKVWIDMNRSQALGGVDDVTDEQRSEMNDQIIELMRKLRWKVDQQLVRRNKRPIFHQNYFDKYEKEEFLIDADMEFYKVKKLLEKNPRLLRDDPVISIDYLKIITLIKQKKLFEKTSNHFDPDNSYMANWLDIKEIDRVKNRKEQAALEKHKRSLLEGGGSDAGGGFDYNSDDETTSANIRDNKK